MKVMGILIHWLDARSEDGWVERKELNMRTAQVTTLGHFVGETKDMLCLASSQDEKTGQITGVMLIPKVCILDRQMVEVNIDT